MYNIKLNNETYFSGPLDFSGMKGELRSFRIFIEKYINCGITLMNLKEIRNNNIENQLRKFVSSHFLDHHDLTAINILCHNNYYHLNLRFLLYLIQYSNYN